MELDLSKSVIVRALIPGTTHVEQRQETVLNLLQELVLLDPRFSISIERVRMAARIEAAAAEATSSGSLLRLNTEEYALIREIVAQPHGGYNPAVARQVLPLLEYILDPVGNHTT